MKLPRSTITRGDIFIVIRCTKYAVCRWAQHQGYQTWPGCRNEASLCWQLLSFLGMLTKTHVLNALSVCVYLDTGRPSQVHEQWQPWSIYQGPGLLVFLDLQSYMKSILWNLGRWQRWHWGGENGFSWGHVYDKVVECITQKEVWSNARSGEMEICRDTWLSSRC